jgi:hypothetical protein
MTAPMVLEKTCPAVVPVRARQPRTSGGATLGQDSSRDAKRLAAALLEVLAGARTPAQAATALGVSLPRYYQLEARALRGLLEGCETRPKGRQPSAERQAAALRRDNQRLQREVSRQQTLLRLSQRCVGLPPPAPPTAAAKGSARKRRRRPAARALHVAARLAAEAALPQLQNSLQQLTNT